jgi:flavin-dependent dehydrogenase
MTSRSEVDVAIIGGGPSGCAAAISLLKYGGLSAVVVESSDYSCSRVGETVSPSITALLAFLGVDDAFRQDGHLPALAAASAWGTAELGDNTFFFAMEGQGWHLDRARFDGRLARTVGEIGGVVITNARASWSISDGGHWLLRVSPNYEPPIEFVARYMIDATGYKATVARSCGARRRIDDQLLAVSTICKCSGGPDSERLLIESARDGWWYAAKLPSERMALCFMSDSSVIRNLDVRRAASLFRLAEPTVHIASRLTDVSPLTPPCVTPAYSSLLEPLGGKNWIAAGDAAASFDPICSLGIGHAIYSGIYAARVACADLVGSGNLLKQYSAGVTSTYGEYLQRRRRLYEAEMRWAEHPFWRRRRRVEPSDYAFPPRIETGQDVAP